MRQIRRRQASVWNAGCGGACWMAGANDSLRQLRRSSASSLSAPGIIITGHRSWPAGSPAKYETSRSEEHTSELQSLMRISYAVFCLKKKNQNADTQQEHTSTNTKRT